MGNSIFLILTFLLFFVPNAETINAQIASKQNGNWHDGSTWDGGNVPNSNEPVVVNHEVTITNGFYRDAATTINGTIVIGNDGWVGGSQMFQYQGDTSRLIFDRPNQNRYHLNTGQRFWPTIHNIPDTVFIKAGAVELNDGSRTVKTLILSDGLETQIHTVTVKERLEMRTDGYLNGTSPNYESGSTLIYNTGSIYEVGTEWHPSSSPHHVHVTGKTTLDYPKYLNWPTDGARSVKGNIIIDSGSSLYMDYGVGDSGPLTVEGNVTVAGNLSLGHSFGWDLIIKGDTLKFEDGYNFYNNERAIQLTRSDGEQHIFAPGSNPLELHYLVIGDDEASSGGHEVIMHQDLLVSAPKGDTAIKIRENSALNINGHKLTVGQLNKNARINGKLKGSETSKLELIGDRTAGTIRFDNGFQNLEKIILNRTPGDTAAILGSNLTLHGESEFNKGILFIENHDLTFKVESSYTKDSGYIAAQKNGKVIREYTPDRLNAFTFPIGDAAGIYSPATIGLGSTSDTVRIGVNVRNEKHPSNTSTVNFLNRYWNVTSEGALYAVDEARFSYVSGDVAGSEGELMTAGYASTNWFHYQPADIIGHALSLTGETDMNKAFTGGDMTATAATANSFFRSKKIGSWQTSDSWEWSSTASGTWKDLSGIYPTHHAKGITIRNGHTITLKSSTTARRLLIEAGGVLDNDTSASKPGHALTIWDDGSTEDDFIIEGEYRLYGKPAVLKDDARAQVLGNAVIKVNRNGTPEANSEGFATNEKVSWNDGAVFEWNPANSSDQFEVKGQTYFPNTPTGARPIFRIEKPVTSKGGEGAFTVNGLFTVNARTDVRGTAGARIFRDGITGSDTLIQGTETGSGFQIIGGSAILGGSNLVLKLQSPMYLYRYVHQGTSIPISLKVPKDSFVTVTGSNLNNNVAGNKFTVEGTLDMTNAAITNTNGQIYIKETGKYRTAHTGGFTGSGSSIPSGTVKLEPGSTVEFYADGNQTFNVANVDFKNIIFSGSGVKEPSSRFRYDGTMTIKDEAIFNASNRNIGDTTVSHLVMTGGKYRTSNSGTSPSIGGNYTLTGGIVEFTRRDSATPQSIRDVTFHNIEVSGNRVRNSTGNITIANNGSFTVKENATFGITRSSIKAKNNTDNNVTVRVEPGGTFRTNSNKGFHGFTSTIDSFSAIHSNITSIILEPGSTVEYGRDTSFVGDGSQPITTSGGLMYQNLILSGSGSKIAPPGDLVIKGNFARRDSAVFKHSDGRVVFSGTAPQIIDADSSVFFDLVNENESQLQIKSDLLIQNTLELTNDSKMYLSEGDVTLISDSVGTGQVLPIPHANAISYASHADSGRFKIERFIPRHPKAWQLLSANTKGGTFREAWQNNQSDDTLRGIWLTSPNYPNGFDAHSPAPSVKYYDPSTNRYIGVSNTSNTMSNHPAYFVFVRGDRSVRAVDAAATATTLHTRGKLFAPGDDAPSSVTIKPDQFGLLGNPYASSIDVKDLSHTGLWDKSYHIWDPNLTIGEFSHYGLGGYRVVNYVGGKRTTVPDVGFEDGLPPLQSGQGFFVHNPTESDITISFTESAKIADDTNIFRMKPNYAPASKIRTNFFIKNSEENILLDGTLQLFDERYSIETDYQDSKKMMNSTENIALPSSRYPLIIERRPFAQEGDTLYYHLTNLSKRNYALQISLAHMRNGGHDVFFNDAYKKTATPLEDGKNTIEFTVDEHPASAKKDRFYLTFKKMQALSLPVRFRDEKAVSRDDRIDVSWTAENQESVDYFVLEHSFDGQSYATLDHVSASDKPSDTYAIAHEEPLAGKHFYRIKALTKTGEPVYSKTVSTEIRYHAPAVSLYPNPATEFIHLNFYRQAHGKYRIKLVNGEGRYVLSKTINHSGLSKVHRIDLPILPAGLYRIEIIGPAGQTKSEKVLIAPR